MSSFVCKIGIEQQHRPLELHLYSALAKNQQFLISYGWGTFFPLFLILFYLKKNLLYEILIQQINICLDY